jgi:hypothetical protein
MSRPFSLISGAFALRTHALALRSFGCHGVTRTVREIATHEAAIAYALLGRAAGLITSKPSDQVATTLSVPFHPFVLAPFIHFKPRLDGAWGARTINIVPLRLVNLYYPQRSVHPRFANLLKNS